MKLLNKLIILSACICLLAVMLLVSAWVKTPKKAISPKPNSFQRPETIEKTVGVENNISESVGEEIFKKGYILRLEGNKICGYVSGGDGRDILWNSMEVPADLSDEERIKLEKGIHTASFEELCLFFESYAS